MVIVIIVIYYCLFCEKRKNELNRIDNDLFFENLRLTKNGNQGLNITPQNL